MCLVEGRGNADGEAQEALCFNGRADEPLEELAARVLEQEDRASTCFG